MKRLIASLIWEPAVMVAAMGWRYRAAREHRRWCDGFRTGYRVGLHAAASNRQEQEQP